MGVYTGTVFVSTQAPRKNVENMSITGSSSGFDGLVGGGPACRRSVAQSTVCDRRMSMTAAQQGLYVYVSGGGAEDKHQAKRVHEHGWPVCARDGFRIKTKVYAKVTAWGRRFSCSC